MRGDHREQLLDRTRGRPCGTRPARDRTEPRRRPASLRPGLSPGPTRRSRTCTSPGPCSPAVRQRDELGRGCRERVSTGSARAFSADSSSFAGRFLGHPFARPVMTASATARSAPASATTSAPTWSADPPRTWCSATRPAIVVINSPGVRANLCVVSTLRRTGRAPPRRWSAASASQRSWSARPADRAERIDPAASSEGGSSESASVPGSKTCTEWRLSATLRRFPFST